MKVLKKEIKVKKYVLEINEEEAHFLKALTGIFFGDPDASYRGIADEIYEALGDDFDNGWLVQIRKSFAPDESWWRSQRSLRIECVDTQRPYKEDE